MRFLGTATIVGPIVLIILTVWIWLAFGTRAHGLVRSMCSIEHVHVEAP